MRASARSPLDCELYRGGVVPIVQHVGCAIQICTPPPLLCNSKNVPPPVVQFEKSDCLTGGAAAIAGGIHGIPRLCYYITWLAHAGLQPRSYGCGGRGPGGGGTMCSGNGGHTLDTGVGAGSFFAGPAAPAGKHSFVGGGSPLRPGCC